MKRVLAIDVGTNTVLGTVAERAPHGALVVLRDEEHIVGLGRGVDRTGQLDPARIAAALAALEAHVVAARGLGCDAAYAVGTSALRDASNRAAFLEPAAAILGAPIEVISGSREAQLTFFGATVGLDPTLEGLPRTVLDIGGGSTELAIGDAQGVHAATSIDIGSVRLFERCLPSDPPAPSDLAQLDAVIEQALRDAPSIVAPIVAVAGTASSVAMLARGRIERTHGMRLSIAELTDVRDRLARASAEARRAMPGMIAARADVLVAGARILCAVARRAAVDAVVVSEGGVRFGVLRERLAG